MPDVEDYIGRSRTPFQMVRSRRGSLQIRGSICGSQSVSPTFMTAGMFNESGSIGKLGDGSPVRWNKYAWPYHRTLVPRRATDQYQILVQGFKETGITMERGGTSPRTTNGYGEANDKASDDWGPGASRVNFGLVRDTASGNAHPNPNPHHSFVSSGSFVKILDTRRDPVACSAVLFRKGYDFAFQKFWRDSDQQRKWSPLAPGVDEGPYWNGYDVVRLWYNMSPGGAHGFSYGILNTRPQFTKSIFRSDHYGYFRDMLEQRKYGKFYITSPFYNTNSPVKELGLRQAGESVSIVECFFVDSQDGTTLVNPYTTDSSNMSTECTSSCPYVDGKALNRPTINRFLLGVALVPPIPTIPIELT